MTEKKAKRSPAETRPKRSVWRILFKLFLALFTLAALAVFAAAFMAFMAYQHVVQPGRAGALVRVLVPEGATGKDVAKLLASNGLVEHELFFRLAVKLDKSGKPIKQGSYALAKGLSASELLRRLQEGPNRVPDASEIPPDRKVTVPEGLTIAQAAKLLGDPEAFVTAARDPELIARLGIKATTLEGFLMPNTYFFDKKPTGREVVERMVAEFEKDYAALIERIPPPLGFDKMAIITIASLVEEEARVNEERRDVAAVIYNRLEKKMPLQLDSTLQYALNKYGQRLLDTDRETNSPYNTYLNPGLPPGPISSPGTASIEAALRPADVDYLYFVSNADGKTHTFSSTDAEHQRAVQRFRREIAPQRKALQEGTKGGATEGQP